MKMTTSTQAGVVVFSVEGRMMRGRADEFGEWMRENIGARWSGQVLLDLGGLTFIDSAGLREILIFAKEIAGRGGRFVIGGLAEEIHQTFRLVGFHRIMDIQDSTDDALASLSHSPTP
ncbi:MAG: STAS domain-containing protein [Rhodospirillaceae bacterium]|nr:STAS domain-containing protein [Rhodospirillaceae bacterium]MDE0360112.1 STAS domain-containing protein [Rhodospirillaceae bacterium]